MPTVREESKSHIETIPLSRSDKQTLFYSSLDDGKSIRESCGIALIAYSTGCRLSRMRRSKSEARSARILKKIEAEAILTDIAEDNDQTGAYRINAINKLGELEGWDKPTHSVHTDTAQLALVDWLDKVYEDRKSSGSRAIGDNASDNMCYVNSTTKAIDTTNAKSPTGDPPIGDGNGVA